VTHWDSLRFYPGEECEIETSTWKPSGVEQEDFQEENGEENDQACYPAAASESATMSTSEGTELVAQGIPTDPAPSTTSAQ
jgi:hypothetical protein